MPFAPSPEPDVIGAHAATDIVGRVPELARIERFLDDAPPGVLVLEGAAGVGKTTLLLEAIERASARKWTVLRSRPAEVEHSFVFAGLRDLLRDIAVHARDRLPEVQRQALAVALAEDEPGPTNEAGVVGVAVLGLLEALAAERPLVVAIDDLQWLDEATGAAVVYAFRRLAEPARLLVACRGVAGGPLPFALQQALDRRSLARCEIGPLSEGAVRRLLRLRLGLDLSRRELHAVYEACAGNPFFALELGRSGLELDESGKVLLPRSLQDVVSERLAALPASTRAALVSVAALADPSEDVLARVGMRSELGPAFEADVLEVENGRLRFTHPLFRSAVWSSVGEERRRTTHRALADAVEGVEARAVHLAAAAKSPNAGVADALEEAATHARRRGAPAAAADLLDRARAVAPPAELRRWARLAEAAALAHAEAGHFDTVQQLVDEAQERLPAGRERAAILVAAAEMRPGLDDLLRQAVTEAGDTSVGVRARIGLIIQIALAGHWGEAVERAGEAVGFARRLGDRALLGVCLTWLGGLENLDSRLDGDSHVVEALAIERELGRLPTSVYESPQMWQAGALMWNGDLSGARALLSNRLSVASERGDDMSAFQTKRLLIELELHSGNWQAAREIGQVALDEAELLGYPYGRPIVLGGLAAVDACEGHLERARALGTEAATSLTTFGDRLWSTYALAALLLTEVCAGNAEAALAHAAAIDERFDEGRECWWSYHQGDALEALVLAGRNEEALARAGTLRRAGDERGLPRFLAWAERGEGLALAAQGELAAAEAAFERALEHHGRDPIALERARTMLAHGHVLRRLRHRHAARAQLGGALAELERLGARHFARVARLELQHVGGRAPAGEHELTKAEDRVARLVASGLSNKEVAAELFVAVSTVEAALTRIYRKLGVRSRSQLAAALADRSAVV